MAITVSFLAPCKSQESAGNQAETSNITSNPSIASSPNANLELVSTIEGGRLYRTGKFNVAVLNGTYREMGRQYGRLLRAQIKGMYEELTNAEPAIIAEMKRLSTKDSSDSPTLENFIGYSFQTYPKRFQEMILGMSETTGMSSDEIGKINEFLRYYVFWKWLEEPDTGSGHCSVMAAWGHYTGGRPLVMGRNFDAGLFEIFNKYLTIIVFNPTDGSNSAAMFTYAGMVGAPQTFNESGLVLEGDDASTAGDNNRPMDRVPVQIREIQLMFDYSTLDGLDAGMKSSRISHALINVVADNNQAYCYETTTTDIKRRSGIDGLLVAVNHFTIPDWVSKGIMTDRSSSSKIMMDSVSRQQNLTALGEKYKGKIDAKVMMSIFDTPREEGGVTSLHSTTYQFVAVPEARTIWLKAPGFEDWQEVNLGALFK
jgi:hypothetical protein